MCHGAHVTRIKTFSQAEILPKFIKILHNRSFRYSGLKASK